MKNKQWEKLSITNKIQYAIVLIECYKNIEKAYDLISDVHHKICPISHKSNLPDLWRIQRYIWRYQSEIEKELLNIGKMAGMGSSLEELVDDNHIWEKERVNDLMKCSNDSTGILLEAFKTKYAR